MQNLPSAESIDLLELSDKTKVSPRTIRYYIQQGLLPTPEARGPGAHYSVEYVDRLNLIRRLQSEHLPLSEIRKRIEKLSPVEIRELVRAEPKRAPDSAADYVKQVLNQGLAGMSLRERPAMSVPHASLLDSERSSPTVQQRSQWERFVFSPDIELHVRRPASREDNRRIERLLEAANEILKEKSR